MKEFVNKRKYFNRHIFATFANFDLLNPFFPFPDLSSIFLRRIETDRAMQYSIIAFNSSKQKAPSERPTLPLDDDDTMTISKRSFFKFRAPRTTGQQRGPTPNAAINLAANWKRILHGDIFLIWASCCIFVPAVCEGALAGIDCLAKYLVDFEQCQRNSPKDESREERGGEMEEEEKRNANNWKGNLSFEG